MSYIYKTTSSARSPHLEELEPGTDGTRFCRKFFTRNIALAQFCMFNLLGDGRQLHTFQQLDQQNATMSSARPPLHVAAVSVKENRVTFECPHCWSKYDRCDEPARGARPSFHEHGIDSAEGRTQVVIRAPHCHAGRFPTDKCQFAIHVTEDTLWIK